MHTRLYQWTGLFSALTLIAATAAAAQAATRNELLKEVKEYKMYFAPLPATIQSDGNPASPAKIALGKQLYFDPRLSVSQKISCNSCHLVDKYGVDNHPTSPGHEGQLGGRNSPTIYNSALNFRQFWDGRAADLEEQALGPVLNPVEMACPDENYVLKVLNSIPDYPPEFKKSFPKDKDPVSYKNVGRAIAAYERTLLTPSPFDKFLAGDDAALTTEQLQGLKTFVDTGCTTCHNGVGIGGHHYQKIGQVKPYKTADEGRFAVTKDPADKYYFKVPSLRNVAKTAPYFHDGSKKTLEETIQTMAEYQLGEKLKPDQVKSIVAFLNSLTGELPKDAIVPPKLPESGIDTPKPQVKGQMKKS